MRKIIPLIVLMLLSALFTNAQNIDQAEKKLSLYSVEANKAAIGITAEQLKNAVVATSYEDVTTGIRYLGLQQSFKGIPVYNQFLILSFRNDQLLKGRIF